MIRVLGSPGMLTQFHGFRGIGYRGYVQEEGRLIRLAFKAKYLALFHEWLTYIYICICIKHMSCKEIVEQREGGREEGKYVIILVFLMWHEINKNLVLMIICIGMHILKKYLLSLIQHPDRNYDNPPPQTQKMPEILQRAPQLTMYWWKVSSISSSSLSLKCASL